MVSFILCSGEGGNELGQWFTSLFGRRGDAILEVNETQYNYSELDKLRKQRRIANIYMRELTLLTLEHVDAALRDLIKLKDKKQAAQNKQRL